MRMAGKKNTGAENKQKARITKFKFSGHDHKK